MKNLAYSFLIIFLITFSPAILSDDLAESDLENLRIVCTALQWDDTITIQAEQCLSTSCVAIKTSCGLPIDFSPLPRSSSQTMEIDSFEKKLKKALDRSK